MSIVRNAIRITGRKVFHYCWLVDELAECQQHEAEQLEVAAVAFVKTRWRVHQNPVALEVCAASLANVDLASILLAPVLT